MSASVLLLPFSLLSPSLFFFWQQTMVNPFLIGKEEIRRHKFAFTDHNGFFLNSLVECVCQQMAQLRDKRIQNQIKSRYYQQMQITAATINQHKPDDSLSRATATGNPSRNKFQLRKECLREPLSVAAHFAYIRKKRV
jgi:hypothetical protein